MQRNWKNNPKETEVYNEAIRNAEIVEVSTYRGAAAKVISKLGFPAGVGTRSLQQPHVRAHRRRLEEPRREPVRDPRSGQRKLRSHEGWPLALLFGRAQPHCERANGVGERRLQEHGRQKQRRASRWGSASKKPT